jgi:hypothetical protein
MIIFATIYAAEGARVSGASRIIGVDLNSNRFEEGIDKCPLMFKKYSASYHV